MPRRIPLLAAWLALLLVMGGWLAASLQPQTDLSLFLPAGESETEELLLRELQQGRASRLLLIGVAGGDPEGRADLSQQLLSLLRRSGEFEQVENGTPGDTSVDPRLLSYRYLLTPPQQLEASLSQEGLRSALQARLGELRSPLPRPFKSLIPRDPTAAYRDLLQRWQARNGIKRTAGVWSSMDGELAMLLALTRDGGLALERQAESVAEIRRRFDKLNPHGDYQLQLTGPGAFAVASKELIQKESRLLSLFASGAIMALLLLAYRHLPYLLYGALPLLSALLTASLLTDWLFGPLHGITLAFGITLLGVTLDYPVHLFSHLSRNEAASRTMGRIWPTLRLGVITTCLGYFVLVTTDFTGLRQLGLFTLIGLLTAALTSRYLLPGVLTSLTPPQPRGGRLLGFLSRRRWTPALLTGGITLLALILLITGPRLWNDDVAVLSPLPASLLEQDRFLRQQLMTEESNQLLLLRGRDPQQLLERCEALKPLLRQATGEGIMAGARLPCDYLPSPGRQRESQGLIPDRETMAARLALALEGLPFRADALAPFLDDLEAARSLQPLDHESLESPALSRRLEHLMRPQAEGWLALAPLRQLKREADLASLLERAPAGVAYLDLRQETSRLIGGFRQGILHRVALGVAVMLAVLWLGLRSLTHALGVLLPILAAILTTLALLSLTGETLNLFHLVSLMLVVGIAIDFSLFFSRNRIEEDEQNQTLHALTLCALSTTSVFLILGSSTIPVLHAIGRTVSFGVLLSYLATYAYWHMPTAPPRGRL